jgi:hypothetical protein
MIKGVHIGLAAATIVNAWFFIHLTYALHYTREYFDGYFAEAGRPAAERSGLAFPASEHPDYYDSASRVRPPMSTFLRRRYGGWCSFIASSLSFSTARCWRSRSTSPPG